MLYLHNKTYKQIFLFLFLTFLLTSLLVYSYGLIQTTDKDNKKSEVIIGNIRIQFLSETLCRIELRGKKGFEDRNTFTVVNREWPGSEFNVEKKANGNLIETKLYNLIVRGQGTSLEELHLETKSGEILHRFSAKKDMPPSSLPDPGDSRGIWLMADHPRIVPPDWGATPAPEQLTDANSGWDPAANAPDIYAFIPGPEGADQIRQDFIKLTGRVPLPPLYAFGLWNSRYHPYNEEEALSVIRSYREKNIPLDVFVLDTDWRKGSSTGYEINEKLFPDMKRFLDRLHNERVYAVLNDHPQAFAEKALAPEELRYRYENLTGLLSLGVDAWWYDRNWHAQLKEPIAGLSKEIWGMRIYHDITQKHRPNHRPLILSNVDGIDHGKMKNPSHPAAHRFPIWWTGDTHPTWEFLQAGITNGVNSGLRSMLPYVSEDIGGHFGQPTGEFYARSVQYGTFSPILRLHSSGTTRYPWDFDDEIEDIAIEYIRLRYRLLPLLYSAARTAYDEGFPILRRCDLYWPRFSEAKSDQQYMFGDDLLIAPVNDVKGFHPIPNHLLQTEDDRQGLTGAYFSNAELSGTPTFIRVDPNVDFDWGEGPGSNPAKGLPEDHFSIRWKSNLGPIPESGQYAFSIIVDDGARLWIDEQLVIDSWAQQTASQQTGKKYLEKGQTYPLRLEYFDNAFKASCKLALWNLDDSTLHSRSVWIPPGTWQDIWTGSTITGPKTIDVSSELWHMPIYVRLGGIILTAPQMQSTQDDLWSTIVVDAFLPEDNGTTTRHLYEDDGISNGYRTGAFAQTPVTLERKGKKAFLEIGKRAGDFPESSHQRNWVIRIHCLQGEDMQQISLNGEKIYDGGQQEKRTGIRILEPVENKTHHILTGEGERPAQDAGRIFEIKVPQHEVQVTLKFAITISAKT